MAAIPKRQSATLSLISTVMRGFMLKALGSHPGAIREGCVTRPVERISRRSQVHRPTIGELASPLVALRGFRSASWPAAMVDRPATSGDAAQEARFRSGWSGSHPQLPYRDEPM